MGFNDGGKGAKLLNQTIIYNPGCRIVAAEKDDIWFLINHFLLKFLGLSALSGFKGQDLRKIDQTRLTDPPRIDELPPIGNSLGPVSTAGNFPYLAFC
jgi:hypothetical protein